jgi:hypothetical protein
VATDIIDITELNCADCGGCMTATCSEHGPQDNVTLRGKVFRCIEWDTERGDECWRLLSVACEDCGSNDVEGL